MLKILPRGNKERSKEYIKRVLLNNIINIKLKPGEQIQESELCNIFNVSRTPVREALIELSQIRLIDIYPQKGTYVSLIDIELVEDGRYLRSILESDLAKQACDVADPEFIEKLHENMVLQEYYANTNVDKFLELDDAFHKEIYFACGRVYLYDIAKNASLHFDRIRKLRLLVANYPLKASSAHKQITIAIENKNKKEASKAMVAHLRTEIFNFGVFKESFSQYFAKTAE